MRPDRRAARKTTASIQVHDVTSIDSYRVMARKGNIINASSTGFLLEIERSDLVPDDLRTNLSLDSLIGHQVVLYLPQMNLDLDGSITRTSHVGKGRFLIGVDFSADVPEYWRECLVDLLPAPGEMEMSYEEED